MMQWKITEGQNEPKTPKHEAETCWNNSNPGIANRTFGNRTQSNSIELNPWIEFD